ncbi:MAG: M20/M25/M40 family metallo-hydrolase [Anaerolineae bacterium]|nr:M20/M25/M40 family metallo-hydrolase [Anaerolineae bacterium]
MSISFQQFDAYVDRHADEYVRRLQALCRIPSIAALGGAAMADAAAVVAELATTAGLDVELANAGGPPVALCQGGSGSRGLLIYNHYDVQPPDPLDEWRTPPFAAEIIDGVLYARGVADNKSNVVARLAALEAYRATVGELPLRVACVFEGEEEIGSLHLARFAAEHADLLRSMDGCVWEAGYKDERDRPVVILGLKGVLSLLLTVRVMNSDAHSGYGGLYPNAAWRLIEALSTLRSADGRVTIDGIWDHVRPPSAAEEAAMAAIPTDDEAVQRRKGFSAYLGGLTGVDALRRLMFEPTCTINGIWGGYTGQGSKTVIPAQASAKLDIRLTPDLTPTIAFDLLRAHLDRRGFTDIEVIEEEEGLMPARTDPTAPVALAAIAALADVHGIAPVVEPTSGGSGPMYQLCQAYGIPAVSIGVGWAQSNAHAPNESMRITDYIEGIKVIGRFIHRFASA